MAASSASILRNQGSPSAAADAPAKGSRGNLGLKRGRWEPESLLEDGTAAMAAAKEGGQDGPRRWERTRDVDGEEEEEEESEEWAEVERRA